MPAYFQMGHDSENLVGIEGLERFAGIVLSPVNRSEVTLKDDVKSFRDKGRFDILFDPQLYCPQSERGRLTSHGYFPNDLDTADPSSDAWWRELVKRLAEEANRLNVDGLCTPAILPKKYTPDYYSRCADSYSRLVAELSETAIRPIMTICLSLKELTDPSEALRIASIVTAFNPKNSYVVVEAEIEPRREIADAVNLFGLMVLIHALEKNGCRTLVSHCSSDMVLM